jgi:hypothetical protein
VQSGKEQEAVTGCVSEENKVSNETSEKETLDAPLSNRRGVTRASTADSMQLHIVRQNGGYRSTGQGGTQEKAEIENEADLIEHIHVNHEELHEEENEERERCVFRTTTADSADLRAARQDLPRRGRRNVVPADQEEHSKPAKPEPVFIEFDNNLSDSEHRRGDLPPYDISRVAGIQSRRGSTGAMPMYNTENEQYFKRSFRRASTGQSQLELCPPPTPPNPSTRMGRRNSTSSMVTTRSEFSHMASYAPSVISVREAHEMSKSFHGYGAHCVQRQLLTDESDSENDSDFHYGDTSNAMSMYGYGTGTSNRASMMARRGSEHSKASRASRRRSGRHDRRSSKKGQEPKQMAAAMDGNTFSHSQGLNSQNNSNADSAMYGYGQVSESESLSESEMSQGSRRSSRSMRRNSVVILPDQIQKKTVADPLGIGKANTPSDDAMDLLNNSGYLEYATQAPPSSSRMLDPGKAKLYAAMNAAKRFHREALASSKPTYTLKTKDDGWGRSTPFTTPRSTLTKEALERKNKSAGIPMEQSIHKISYHHRTLDIDSSVDSSSDGGELYRDKDPNAHNEYDEYHQRPRRRESLDKTMINMSDLLHKSKKKKVVVPRFTPAVNCSNASDYIVRAFVARLRLGLTVIKHNHSRWSKSQQRELVLLPDGHSLTWKPLAGDKDKGRRPKMDLLKCKEVRHAWSKDPETRKKLGTAVIRSRCKDSSSVSKSFSLIFPKKTLDMTAMSTDSCKMLMEGFSALCFRLQLDKLTTQKEDPDHHPHPENNYASDDNNVSHYDGRSTRSVLTDDDWASTIYQSTTSKTQSNTVSGSTLNSPWGF